MSNNPSISPRHILPPRQGPLNFLAVFLQTKQNQIDEASHWWQLEAMTKLQQWLGDRLEDLAHTLRSKSVHRDHLKAAILKRRDRHRQLNKDWQHVDQDVIARSS